MKEYEKFSVTDFIMDEYFRRWVTDPTPEVEEFWEQWSKLHPHKKGELQEARRLFQSIDFKKTPLAGIPADALLSRIRASIRETASAGVEHGKVPSRRRSATWYRVAAALAGLAIMTTALYYLTTLTHTGVSYHTAFNEKREIVLPDRSVVVLNANSTLHYPNDWNAHTTREVWLEGEAFFEVKKYREQGNARFVVHTGHLDVEVLGTAFNVNNRRGRTRVVLNEGKVRLTSDRTLEKAITMKPGEMAELETGQKKFVKKKVNPEVYSSWRSDQLIFEKTPLREIIVFIEDNYGIKVENRAGNVGDLTFTGTIPSRDLDVLLQVVSETYNVRIMRDERTIQIVGHDVLTE